MAIDTPAKRKSMIAFGQSYRPAFQHPDATEPFGWRQAWVWGYAGIEWADPVIVAGPPLNTWLMMGYGR